MCDMLRISLLIADRFILLYNKISIIKQNGEKETGKYFVKEDDV